MQPACWVIRGYAEGKIVHMFRQLYALLFTAYLHKNEYGLTCPLVWYIQFNSLEKCYKPINDIFMIK